MENNLPTKVRYHLYPDAEWYWNEDNLPIEHDLQAEQELNFEDNRR